MCQGQVESMSNSQLSPRPESSMPGWLEDKTGTVPMTVINQICPGPHLRAQDILLSGNYPLTINFPPRSLNFQRSGPIATV